MRAGSEGQGLPTRDTPAEAPQLDAATADLPAAGPKPTRRQLMWRSRGDEAPGSPQLLPFSEMLLPLFPSTALPSAIS